MSLLLDCVSLLALYPLFWVQRLAPHVVGAQEMAFEETMVPLERQSPPPAVIGDLPISRLLDARLPERFLEASTCADGPGAPSSGVLRQAQLWGGVRRC